MSGTRTAEGQGSAQGEIYIKAADVQAQSQHIYGFKAPQRRIV